jgi:hypothetical protein
LKLRVRRSGTRHPYVTPGDLAAWVDVEAHRPRLSTPMRHGNLTCLMYGPAGVTDRHASAGRAKPAPRSRCSGDKCKNLLISDSGGRQ